MKTTNSLNAAQIAQTAVEVHEARRRVESDPTLLSDRIKQNLQGAVIMGCESYTHIAHELGTHEGSNAYDAAKVILQKDGFVVTEGKRGMFKVTLPTT